jgi:uncharacterized Fe-S radical SAM superfamily protein PflX
MEKHLQSFFCVFYVQIVSLVNTAMPCAYNGVMYMAAALIVHLQGWNDFYVARTAFLNGLTQQEVYIFLSVYGPFVRDG